MAEQSDTRESQGGWIWDRLRGKSRKELDRIQRDLVKRPGEKREYVGDPNQDRRIWVRTRNK